MGALTSSLLRMREAPLLPPIATQPIEVMLVGKLTTFKALEPPQTSRTADVILSACLPQIPLFFMRIYDPACYVSLEAPCWLEVATAVVINPTAKEGGGLYSAAALSTAAGQNGSDLFQRSNKSRAFPPEQCARWSLPLFNRFHFFS